MNRHGNRSLVSRMVGAAFLQVEVYEEVEADEGATGQAALAVGIVALASALGGVTHGAGGFLGFLIATYLGWLTWAGITYLIGDKILGGTATWGELLRTLGFAQSPGILYLVAILPLLGWFVRLFVWVWLLVAGIVAIRQALDFGTGKAILTGILGWISLAVLSGLAQTLAASPSVLF